jgi:hypothetical protein
MYDSDSSDGSGGWGGGGGGGRGGGGGGGGGSGRNRAPHVDTSTWIPSGKPPCQYGKTSYPRNREEIEQGRSLGCELRDGTTVMGRVLRDMVEAWIVMRANNVAASTWIASHPSLSSPFPRSQVPGARATTPSIFKTSRTRQTTPRHTTLLRHPPPRPFRGCPTASRAAGSGPAVRATTRFTFWRSHTRERTPRLPRIRHQ